MAVPSPVPELNTTAARARSQTVPPPVTATAPEVIQARYAFLIYATPAGEVILTPDLDAAVTVERAASPDEIKGACQVIAGHIQTQETMMLTTQNILMNLQRMGQARAVSADPSVQEALSKLRRPG
jgi:hypothetical protein